MHCPKCGLKPGWDDVVCAECGTKIPEEMPLPPGNLGSSLFVMEDAAVWRGSAPLVEPAPFKEISSPAKHRKAFWAFGLAMAGAAVIVASFATARFERHRQQPAVTSAAAKIPSPIPAPAATPRLDAAATVPAVAAPRKHVAKPIIPSENSGFMESLTVKERGSFHLFTATGWVADAGGIQSPETVFLTVDGKKVCDATLGETRNDVASPQGPQVAGSDWHCVFAYLPPHASSAHTLDAWATWHVGSREIHRQLGDSTVFQGS